MVTGNMEVDFPCPECEKEFKVKLSQIQEKAIVKCPRCKKDIDLKKEEDQLKKLDKKLIEIASDFRDTDFTVSL
ncbi:MJ0042-type zinc finger domain-containing protein [Chloroflexota bacterium]